MIMYKKIAVAVSYNDRSIHLVSEAAKLAKNFGSQLYLFHVYATDQDNRESLLKKRFLSGEGRVEGAQVYSAKGKVHTALQNLCKLHSVDVLIFGASEKKGLMDYFKDSITLSLYKNSHTSLMILTHTNTEINSVDRIEVVAESKAQVEELTQIALDYCATESIHKLKINRIVDKGLANSLVTSHEDMDELLDFEKRVLKGYCQKTKALVDQMGVHEQIEVSYAAVFENDQSELYPDTGNNRLLITKNLVQNSGMLDKLFTPKSTEIIKNPPCRLLILQ